MGVRQIHGPAFPCTERRLWEDEHEEAGFHSDASRGITGEK